jgi:hypothetical protein
VENRAKDARNMVKTARGNTRIGVHLSGGNTRDAAVKHVDWSMVSARIRVRTFGCGEKRIKKLDEKGEASRLTR